MRAAIGGLKGRIDRAPAHHADLALHHSATPGEDEIRTRAANLVPLRHVLIVSRGLCQLLLLLRLVLLGFGSRATSGGRGGNAHRLDKSPPRRSGSRHVSLSLAPWLNDIRSVLPRQSSPRFTLPFLGKSAVPVRPKYRPRHGPNADALRSLPYREGQWLQRGHVL